MTGQYYYQSLGGMALNQFAAFWSMFPPLFALPTHPVSDRYALELLVELCRRGPGQILGIHPEGGRNLDPDPYALMRCQPGTGKIIHAARPIVIPCFIAGLDNSVATQIRRNWSGGEPVRVWFDAPVALDEQLALPGKGSTYKQITELVMARVRELAERDRARHAPATRDGDARGSRPLRAGETRTSTRFATLQRAVRRALGAPTNASQSPCALQRPSDTPHPGARHRSASPSPSPCSPGAGASRRRWPRRTPPAR